MLEGKTAEETALGMAVSGMSKSLNMDNISEGFNEVT